MQEKEKGNKGKKNKREIVIKTTLSFIKQLPLLISIIFLISALYYLIPKNFYCSIFNRSNIVSVLLGALIGSVSIGNPSLSYIIAGELLNKNISVIPVISFIVAWTTVGIIQFPVESSYFGLRFTVLRNLLSFIFSIIIAFISYFLLKL